MSAYRIIDLPQGSDEWLAFRVGKIGGSDAYAVCKTNNPSARENLLAEKRSGKKKEYGAYTQAIFQSGHDWEIKVRDSINESLKRNFQPIVIQHHTCDEFFASLDGLSEDKTTTLEVKSTKQDQLLSLVKRGICPPEWEYQIQWGMYISETFECVLAVVDSRNGEVFLNEYKRDDELLEFIIDRAINFKDDLVNHVVVKHKLELSQDEEMKYILNSKKVVKEYQKLIDEEEEKIKSMAEKILADFKSEKVEAHGVIIEWREKKGAVDYKTVKELDGVDLEKYRKKPSRSLYITESKQNKIEETTNEII